MHGFHYLGLSEAWYCRRNTPPIRKIMCMVFTTWGWVKLEIVEWILLLLERSCAWFHYLGLSEAWNCRRNTPLVSCLDFPNCFRISISVLHFFWKGISSGFVGLSLRLLRGEVMQHWAGTLIWLSVALLWVLGPAVSPKMDLYTHFKDSQVDHLEDDGNSCQKNIYI